MDTPWLDELNCEFFIAGDLPCVINRGYWGQLNGYVGVPPGHPWSEMDMSDFVGVDVHGGVTYVGPFLQQWAEDHPDVFTESLLQALETITFVGFDTAHVWDFMPHPGVMNLPGAKYRTFDYVKQQVLNLAGQAAEASAHHRSKPHGHHHHRKALAPPQE